MRKQRDFDESTLWRISAYERMRADTGTSGFVRLERNTVLPTTLLNELAHRIRRDQTHDLLDVLALCVRQRESALLLIRHAGLIWPLTIFPAQGIYHLPRPIIDSLEQGGRDVTVMNVEPPGFRPPGHEMYERIGDHAAYRPLPPLLWAVALHGPRSMLIDDIAGRAAYRVSADFHPGVDPVPGALGPVVQRLRVEITALRRIAEWPGMNEDRAMRLLNAVYLLGGLMVLRTHHRAHDPVARGGWLERLRGAR